MLEKPGRKPKSATARSTTTARAWDPTAKSTTVVRLRAEARWRPLLSAVITMSVIRLAGASHVEVTVARATSDPFTRLEPTHAITGVATLLQLRYQVVHGRRRSWTASGPLIPP